VKRLAAASGKLVAALEGAERADVLKNFVKHAGRVQALTGTPLMDILKKAAPTLGVAVEELTSQLFNEADVDVMPTELTTSDAAR